MRLIRILHEGRPRYARCVDESQARLWTAAPWHGGAESETTVEWTGRLLAPVEPSKIVCVGRNYQTHAAELGNEVPKEPLLFLKPPSALLAPGGTIRLPPESARVDYEGEIAVVVGRRMDRDTKRPRRDLRYHLR